MDEPLTPGEAIRHGLCRRGEKLLEEARAIRDAGNPSNLPLTDVGSTLSYPSGSGDYTPENKFWEAVLRLHRTASKYLEDYRKAADGFTTAPQGVSRFPSKQDLYQEIDQLERRWQQECSSRR